MKQTAVGQTTATSEASSILGISWKVATFLLVNAALGAGMLHYPYAYNEVGGVLVTTLMQVILLLLIAGTMFILIYCADVNNDDTYHDVLQSMCGKRAQQVSAMSILLTCYGINVTFLVIIGDQFDRIFESLAPDCTSSCWYLDRKFTITITAVLFIWPMCYAQRLDFLRYASILGLFSMFYVVFLTFYEYIQLDTNKIAQITALNHTQVLNDMHITKQVKWFEPLTVVPVLCFAYQTHEIAVPVYACLKKRCISEFVKATITSLLILFVIYNIVGSVGYITFGINVGPDIMSMYDGKDPIVVVGIVALVIKFITTYPSLMFCGRGALENLYGEFMQISEDEHVEAEKSRRVLITTIWFVTSVFLATVAPNITVTLQLLGSLAAINVFVFPGLCLISLTRQLDRHNHTYSNLSMQNYNTCRYATFTNDSGIEAGRLISAPRSKSLKLCLYLCAALLILFGAFIFVLEIAFVFLR